MATKCAVYAYHVNLSLELPYNREKRLIEAKKNLKQKHQIKTYVRTYVELFICVCVLQYIEYVRECSEFRFFCMYL